MSMARTVWARETAAAFVSPAFYTALTVFQAVVAGLFAAALRFGEGRCWSLPALWTLAAGLPLPLLAAAATMRLFAGERAGGTLETLLSLPVPERDILAGKFAAALLTVWLGVAGAVTPWLLLRRALPEAVPPPAALAAPLVMLMLQALAWTALGTLASVLARCPWNAAAATVAAIPGAAFVWGLGVRFLPGWSRGAALFPPLAELLDAAAGRLSLAGVVLHLSLAWWCLFAGARVLEARRWR